jgi:hypothetical protein
VDLYYKYIERKTSHPSLPFKGRGLVSYSMRVCLIFFGRDLEKMVPSQPSLGEGATFCINDLNYAGNGCNLADFRGRLGKIHPIPAFPSKGRGLFFF